MPQMLFQQYNTKLIPSSFFSFKVQYAHLKKTKQTSLLTFSVSAFATKIFICHLFCGHMAAFEIIYSLAFGLSHM